MRKFAIELNEWYKKDDDGCNIGHTIHNLTYEQEEGKQNTIKDLKTWILFKGLNINEDLCPCFLKIQKYSHYDNIKKTNIVGDVNYSDNTLLDSTEFNEKNVMYLSFDKSRKCTCGKMNEMKIMSNMVSKKFEDQFEQNKKKF